MRFAATAESDSLFSTVAPIFASGMGALPENLSLWGGNDGTLSTPLQGTVIRSTYSTPANYLLADLPVYADLPPAPPGSQGSIDFPYPIKQPFITGNYYWWSGGGVINQGYPQYSNDCWEYLRSAVVDSDFATVGKWLQWAVNSFKWSVADVQAFNFALYRWVSGGAYAGVQPGMMWRVPNYNQASTQVIPQQPATASAAPLPNPGPGRQVLVTGGGTAARGGRLQGLGAVNVFGPPYSADLTTYPLVWSLADLQAFYNMLEPFAGPQSQCLPSLLRNWRQMWQNYMTGPGGPVLSQVQLSACPAGDDFWKGFATFILEFAALATVAYAAGTLIVAASTTSATVGTAATVTTSSGEVLADVVVPNSVIETAATTAAATVAPGTVVATVATDAIPEIVTTATFLPAAGITVTQAVVAATVAVAGTVAVTSTGGSATADANATQPSGNGSSSNPDTSATDGTAAGTAAGSGAGASGGMTAADISSALNAAKTAAGLVAAVVGATKPHPAPGTMPGTMPGTVVNPLSATVAGIPVWILGLGVIGGILLLKGKR